MTAFPLVGLLCIAILFSETSTPSLKKADTESLMEVYDSERFTLFCHQAFTSDGKLVLPRCSTCPNQPLPIKWMPIVPLKRLALHLPCYHNKRCVDNKGRWFGGIRCCEKMDPLFNIMRYDLNNYVPENPILVKMRGQLPFNNFTPKHSAKGCHFYIDKKNRTISPAPSIRGFIARAYLRMHHRYHIPLSDEEFTLFTKWDEQFPLSDWERKRNQLIAEKMLSRNS